jgi:hypothetical protein
MPTMLRQMLSRVTSDRRLKDRSRFRRRLRPDLVMLEDRITPTSVIVTGLSPTFGPTGGGTLVTINGTGLAGATGVEFGKMAAAIVSVTSSAITAYSPEGTGIADVTVTTPAGTSATSPADQFGYVSTISGISPTDGALSGGTLVTITGTGFTNATGVDFGEMAAAIASITSTTITAYSPAGTGTVGVSVIAPGGPSPASPSDIFTYIAAPTVSGLNPTAGPAAGGTMVTITGTGLTGATAVDFGTNPVMIASVSDTSITADSPAGAGTVNVTVTTPLGTSPVSTADQFTYAPTISSISPTFGLTTGNTLVTITGTGFASVTAVDFGTQAATIVSISATSIAVDSPPGSGSVPVFVSTPSEESVTLPPIAFTYAGAIVSAVRPSLGLAAGNTPVTITGAGLANATQVDFGTTPGTIVSRSATSILVNSPGGAGTVNVTVNTAQGPSLVSTADQFNYLPAPAISSISPALGPTSGGTLVTITGTGFTGASAVDFGTKAATIVSGSVSLTSIVVYSPPGSNGVSVSVTTPSGVSLTEPSVEFAYVALPTVTAVSPAFGPAAGDIQVTITGIGFTNASEVDFGTIPGTIVSVSASSITADSPSGVGTVDVTVTTPSGKSAILPADQFTNVGAPTISSISPASGAATGGSLVTIKGTNLAYLAAIDFGTRPVTTVFSDSATQIILASPVAPSFGPVNVSVNAPGGTSAPTPADSFDYFSNAAIAPVVSGITPKYGAPAGGTVVTITGTCFESSTPAVVYFGSTLATGVTVLSATKISAVSPVGTGPVDVTVITLGGPSATSPADLFTYTMDGPSVLGVQLFVYRAAPTSVVIDFNGPLDASTAQNVSNYQIVGPGGSRIKVKSVNYNPVMKCVTLVLAERLKLRTTYRLTINGTTSIGLKNPDELLLDGAGTGQPGSNYVTTIATSNLAGPVSERPIAPVVKAKARMVVVRLQTTLHRHAR